MVGRYVRFTAQPGRGETLEALLLEVARSLNGTPGCRVYAVNRVVEEADVVIVGELWESQEHVDAALAALQTEAGRARLGEVMALLSGPPQRTDLQPLGGVGID